MKRSDDDLPAGLAKVDAIRASGLTIYDTLLENRPDLFLTDNQLEAVLTRFFVGREVAGENRTRSKIAKSLVAEALGYPVPTSFPKTVPRFPGQDLDVSVQTRDNLQIWNQEVSPERRYVLMRPDESGIVQAVRVVRGQVVATWDRTGTLTSKYQAKRIPGRTGSRLVVDRDTTRFREVLRPRPMSSDEVAGLGVGDAPKVGALLPIADVYERLLDLVGQTLTPVRPGQDRVRGELLQVAVSEQLGLGAHANPGSWPDVLSQAIEVKLQTAETVDLGMVLPSDAGPAPDIHPLLRHCDARYVVAYGDVQQDGSTALAAVVVTTGESFFDEFQQFGGLVSNSKRQLPLPKGLFDPE